MVLKLSYFYEIVPFVEITELRFIGFGVQCRSGSSLRLGAEPHVVVLRWSPLQTRTTFNVPHVETSRGRKEHNNTTD